MAVLTPHVATQRGSCQRVRTHPSVLTTLFSFKKHTHKISEATYPKFHHLSASSDKGNVALVPALPLTREITTQLSGHRLDESVSQDLR